MLKADWQDLDYVGDGASIFKNLNEDLFFFFFSRGDYLISVSWIQWKNQNTFSSQKNNNNNNKAEFLIAESQWALQTRFQNPKTWCASQCSINPGGELKGNSWPTFISQWSWNYEYYSYPRKLTLLLRNIGILWGPITKQSKTKQVNKTPHNYSIGIISCGNIGPGYPHLFIWELGFAVQFQN